MKLLKMIGPGLVLLLALAGCAQPTPTAAPAATPDPSLYPAPQISNDPSDSYPPFTEAQTHVYPAGELPAAPQDAPVPEAGKGSISGVFFSITQRTVIPGTFFYLAPGWGENRDEVPQMLVGPQSTDISALSDDNGNFSVNNIPPGTYYFVIQAWPQNWDYAYPEETSVTPRKIVIEPDSQNQLGVLFFYFP